MARKTKHRKYKKINKRRTMKGGIRIDDDDDEPFVEGDFNESEIKAIPNATNDSHYLDINDTSFDLNVSNISDDPLNQSFNSVQSNGPLRLSDLNVSDESGYTTGPDESLNVTGFNNSSGGKKRKNSKKRNVKKGRKTRKNRRVQKGGVCYGNGVGANTYDPNYSIYNTNMLKLFPYKA